MKVIKKYRGVLYNTITSVGLVLLGELNESCGLYKGHQILSAPRKNRRKIHNPSRIYLADADLAEKDTDQRTIQK
jgi:hypothetical protein